MNATSYAMQLFRSRNAHFYFLNIVKVWNYTTDDLMTASGSEVLYNTILNTSKQRLEQKVDQLKKRYSEQDFEYTALIDYDVFTDAINQAIATYDIDCIIMGSDGASNVVERIFGSHSTRVLRQVSCPILVVPDAYRYKPAERLLIVFGEGKQYDRSIFMILDQLFHADSMQVSILRLSEKEPIHVKEELEQVATDFKQEKVPYFKLTKATESRGRQLHIVDQVIKADINIVSITSASFLSRIVKQSPIASMIGTVEKPTLFLER